jgi:hypothetical protein
VRYGDPDHLCRRVYRGIHLFWGISPIEKEQIMFFTEARHKAGWLTAMQGIGKVYDGWFDTEYGAALYILTADEDTWNQVSDYVSHSGIDFEAMLHEVDFSGGYGVLIRLAANLFNDRIPCNVVELMRLDERNFKVALTAIQVRGKSLHMDDFK